MTKRNRIEPSRLITRYALAICLLVAFVLGGHGLHVATGKQGVLDEEIINKSGRQRMLSQRIVLLSHRYNDDADQARYADLLKQSVRTFELSHEWLMSEAIDTSNTINAHYTAPHGARLDERSKAFAALATSLLEKEPGSEVALGIAERIEDVALVDLLGELNMAVTLFEDAANTRGKTLEYIQIAVVLATIIVLFLEIRLIFYPAHKAMVGMIDRLRFQAWHDHMTGLANRSRFLARATEMMNDTPRKLNRMFILAMDLDGFKEVNDTLGHPVGDQVLRHVAKLLRNIVNSEQHVGELILSRVGGDEFLVCGHLPTGDVAKFARELGEKIIAEVEKPILVKLDDNRAEKCVIGVSIGYTFGQASKGNIDLFLSNADIALYESKRSGKGIATAFEGRMRDTAEKRHRLTSELKLALRGLEFKPFFQPQIDLNTGKIYGVEALARWDHPERGLIGPGEFMEMAEDSRVIDALDGQIMLAAFEAHHKSKSEGVDLGRLSLNASGMALRNSEFCDILLNVAHAHGMSPDQITIEVLESLLIQGETDPATETIQKLARAGFGIAVDDFGVGYSSLSRLSREEITAIKIDRSLVQRMNEGNMEMVLGAIAAMAKGINATLLAEGIENKRQLASLERLGVDIGQGFFWTAPLSLSETQKWVRARSDGDIRLVSSN